MDKSLRGLLLLAASFLGLVTAGCAKSPVFECEVRLLLPATTVDPENQRTYGKLTVNGQEIPETPARRRLFKVKLAKARDIVTVVYSFWPKTYTNIIRTRVVPAVSGQVAELDLTGEDPANPDRIQPAFITTPMPVVEEMCKMARIGPSDVVYDIGCGDGRMVITAVAKFGVSKGLGIDIDPDLIEKCRENAQRAGVANKIEFRVQDALQLKDLSDASVVMLFVGEDLNLKLRPLLQRTLKPGARVISHQFDMGDWRPDLSRPCDAVSDEGTNLVHTLHMWTIK